jgi:DNA-binding Xre family transcriptional regulator
MKLFGEDIRDIADILNTSIEDLRDKLDNNKYLNMSQLDRLCEHYECGPEAIMSWSPDGDLVKIDWDKVAAFGKPLTVLSVECGMSRSALSNTRKGSGKVKTENARKIAEVLNCRVEDLL